MIFVAQDGVKMQALFVLFLIIEMSMILDASLCQLIYAFYVLSTTNLPLSTCICRINSLAASIWCWLLMIRNVRKRDSIA